MLVVFGTASRIWIGPWYHLYNPADARLIDGIPSTWEVVYFAPHLSSFTSSVPPSYGLAQVQTRALLPLALSALVASLTSHVGVALLVVETTGWFLASAMTERLGRAMGVSPTGAMLAGVLVATSPMFSSQVGMLVLHPAEFASLPIGLFAVRPYLAFITNPLNVDYSRALRAGLSIGSILIILSLSYVYQFAIVFVLVVAFFVSLIQAYNIGASLRILYAFFILSISLATFVIFSVFIKKALLEVGLAPLAGEVSAVAQPMDLALELIRSRGWWDAFASLISGLPTVVELAITAYHPLPLLVGIVGIVCTPSIRVHGIALTVFGAVSSFLYHAPWTAMTAYPIVYLGVGRIISIISGWCANQVTASEVRYISMPYSTICNLSTLIMIVGIVISTNRDLFGDTTFAIQWWQAYWPVLPY